MEVVTTVAELRRLVRPARNAGSRVGFVPTMGALHEGHLSLVKECRSHADLVVMSIFVNPLQFGANEDFGRYPRDREGDISKARQSGVDICFMPEEGEVYPVREGMTVNAGPLAGRWEGKVRPGHFDGVLTVVARLFGMVQPHVAVFGQKDYQQAALVSMLIREFSLDIQMVIAAIVRDHDGLALSSRNAYLSPAQRAAAASIPAALGRALLCWQGGERRSSTLVAEAARTLNSGGMAVHDYLAVVDPQTLEPVDSASEGAVLLLAVRAGSTRLLDNVVLSPTDPPGLPLADFRADQ